ncbi:MAG TPA: hypothetical protein VKT29_03945 [Terriglobales bacterium]|nr:hypothetical protein [Terriglobales bacterium]
MNVLSHNDSLILELDVGAAITAIIPKLGNYALMNICEGWAASGGVLFSFYHSPGISSVTNPVLNF